MNETNSGPTNVQATYLLAARKELERRKYQSGLRKILAHKVTNSQLKDICHDLGVDYKSLPGEGHSDKARELMEHLERMDRISDLVAIGQQLRPDLCWGDPDTSLEDQTPASEDFHSTHKQKIAPQTADQASTPPRQILADRRAIVAKMSKIVSELDAYIDQYDRAIRARRLSASLRELPEQLRTLAPAEPIWGIYWKNIEQTYDELPSLAFGMEMWREARRPQTEPSDITAEVRALFSKREYGIWQLVDQYTAAQACFQQLTARLRRRQSEQPDQDIVELEKQIRAMFDSTDTMERQLFLIINELVKKELYAQLTQLDLA